MVHRLLAHLVAILFVVAFAAPAMAHVHGGHPATAVTTTASATPVAHEAAAPIAVAEVRAASVARPAPCDRDCGHDDGMSGCACMASCLALTAAELPHAAVAPTRLAHGFVQTPPRPGAGHHPPVPPPRS